MKRAPVLALALALLAVPAALTQPPAKPQDPQSTFEPRSNPGAGQKFLEKFVGDWDVEKAFFPRSGDPSRSRGECRQTMIHGGRFLRSEFTFEGRGGKSTGTGLIGFESDSKKFTSVWTDSRATRMSFRQSREPFDGAEIVLFSNTLGAGGATRERSGTRTVTRLEDEGRRIVHRQYAIAADGKERLMMELLMTRKASNGNTQTPGR